MIFAQGRSRFCLLASVFSMFSLPLLMGLLIQSPPLFAATTFSPQTHRWNTLELILQNLKDDPESADEDYLADGSTRALIKRNLEKCDYTPGAMDSIDHLIAIFWDKEKGTTRPYDQIAKALDEMKSLSLLDRLSLHSGALADASFTLGALKTHSCRAYLQWQIELGATRADILRIIEELKSGSK